MLHPLGMQRFTGWMSVQDPILQQAAAKLAASDSRACYSPSLGVLPQRLYLRAELVDDLLEILDRGQLLLDWRRQLAGDPISGHTDRLIDVLESKLHHGAAPALAQENPDARAFDWRSHRAVHGSQVEAELAGMLGLEVTHLEFEDKIAMQTDMVEEQIDVEGSAVHGDWELTAYEGKPSAQFQEKIAQMAQEPILDLAFPGRCRHGQEIEVVGVLENLLRQIGFQGRQGSFEVCKRLPFPLVQVDPRSCEPGRSGSSRSPGRRGDTTPGPRPP